MNVEKIEKLEELLQENLGPQRKVTSYKLSRLTAAGDNYGSLMLRLDILLKNENTNAEEKLDAVAKLLPPTELLRQIFNIQVTFVNEISFYSVIVPVLTDFYKKYVPENPLDFFPRYYGARISLDGNSNIVDQNAVLVLENLKTAGFAVVDRTKGYDLDTALFLLRNLACFHAVGLAIKIQQPEIFHQKIRPFCYKGEMPDDGMEELICLYDRILNENEKCAPHLERVRELFKQKLSSKTEREPFVTLTHNDFWINNTMIKFKNNKAVANKFLDFQHIGYDSPCKDLVFFLFTSVKQNILEQKLDHLFDFYYNSLIEELTQLKCDTTPFSKDIFQEEIAVVARESQYYHIMFMLPGIMTECEIPELDKLTLDDFKENRQVTNACKEKIWYITMEFVKRGWLY